MTDTIRFHVTEHRWPARPGKLFLEVMPVLNGVSLNDLLKPVELPFAEAEGHPDNAGSYDGLRGDAENRRGHYFDQPVESWFEDGDTVLLSCPGCGEWGCWPFTVYVVIVHDRVKWTNLRHGHRDWDYSAIGEWEFDRTEYERALASLPSG